MPYIAESNLLFLHIPKNAGKSVEVALGVVDAADQSRRRWRSLASRLGTGLQRVSRDRKAQRRLWGIIDVTLTAQHLTLQEVELLGLIEPTALVNARKLAIVRDPYTRAVSLYLHWRRSSAPPTQEEFREFWNEWPCRTPRDHNERAHHRRQVDYVRDASGAVAIQCPVHFESLELELSEWAQTNNVSLNPVPHIGSQRHSRIGDLYDEKSRATINSLFEEDFSIFGYPTS